MINSFVRSLPVQEAGAQQDADGKSPEVSAVPLPMHGSAATLLATAGILFALDHL